MIWLFRIVVVASALIGVTMMLMLLGILWFLLQAIAK